MRIQSTARSTALILLLAAGGLVKSVADSTPATGFIAGADFSHTALFEARGKVYRDAGQARDPFAILRGHGFICVRLRLFTSSAAQAANDPYNYINNLDYTVPLARRVKQAGLRFMLDFHYSDTWADPGHQAKPAAWANLSFAQLEQRMYDYNSNCLAAFKAAAAMPDYVQVGNEITSGMLWPDGAVGGTNDTPAQWTKLGQLMKAAIRGIQDASGSTPPRIVVHIDRGGDWAGTQWFFDRLQQQQVQFDIVGQSYYPFWHGTLSDLRTCLTNAAQRYGKPLIVAETAFPWVKTNWDGTPIAPLVGINPGPDGQVQFTAALAAVVKGVPGGLGLGIFWWGAEYQTTPGLNLAGFDGKSFFDSSGNALPVVDAFGRLARPVLQAPARPDKRGAFLFSVPGPIGETFDVQATPDFTTWFTLATVTNTNGAPLVSTTVTNSPAAFYRVRQY